MAVVGKAEIRLPPYIFDRPHRLNSASAWHRHIPFAFWLVSVTRPRRLVELGTHWGDSYFAFCQAAQNADVPVEAFAVDSWLGDEHAGPYGEDVFEDVREWNELYYGDFSTLLRMLFDEAVGEFDDGSIDVLHIDGLHTYEAVRHDFDIWRPKLSERGVVLFHDTEELGRGFGVHRLWDELANEFPSFGFQHGHGLGVTLVGPEAPHPLRQLAAVDPSEEPLAGMVNLFEALGDRVALMSEVRELTDLLEARVNAFHEEQVRLLVNVESLEDERSKLESALGAVEGERSKLEGVLGAVEGERSKLEGVLGAVEGERSKLEAHVQLLDADRDEARRRLVAVNEELADERQFGLRRWTIEQSWSHRLRMATPQRWGLLDRAMKDRW